ncbi:hypothetical protein EYC54_07050 [Xanthomonas oryzae]|nr:hypothetical protein EYC54_07050 [Xanthomonas oryzae]
MECDRGGACGAVQGRWLRVEGTELRPAPSPPPAPRRCPRLRRGRSKARAPLARKLCLLAPAEEGLNSRPHTTAP